MSALLRVYRAFNLLSLDVVTGAIVSALFFARILHVDVKAVGIIALGLTVWIIYTADHLRDARKIAGVASTERHRFHQVHHRTLIILTLIALILDVIAILFIKQQVLQWGIVLSFVVFAYLVVQGALKFLKEMFIAILYTCGVLLLSIPVSNVTLTTSHYILILQFGITALANLVMFSWFDRENDQQDKRHSFVTKVGEPAARFAVWFLSFLPILLIIVQWRTGVLLIPSILVGCMCLILLIIFVFRVRLGREDYYRLLGDGIFFVPGIYLFFSMG